MRPLRARLSASDREGQAGFTLIELLVAAAMSVVLVGAAGSMLISAVRTQPSISEKAQNISTARYVLERMTREIRNGVTVDDDSSASVASFVTRVRRTSCGGGVEEEPGEPAIECQVTYTCTGGTCARTEAAPGAEAGGPAVTIVTGLSSDEVFEYQPSAEEAEYIGVRLNIANPEGPGELTVTDGANLRTLSLSG